MAALVVVSAVILLPLISRFAQLTFEIQFRRLLYLSLQGLFVENEVMYFHNMFTIVIKYLVF